MSNDKILNQKRKRPKEDSSAKEELISKILSNFKPLEEIFKTEKAQNIFNSIGLFSFEEYSKFFQNLSNKEYTSMSEHPKKNREPISIDKSKLKLDYSSPHSNEHIINSANDILKTNLEPKGIPKKIKESLNKVIPKTENAISLDIYLKAISENINNLINSRNDLSLIEFKQLIKIYSILIRAKDSIYLKKEPDQLFLELLEKKFLTNSYANFFNLSSFWLYTEYLLCCENDNIDINEITRFKRYDEILRNITQILNKLVNKNINIINYKSEFNNFISNVPLYNKAFIDLIINYHQLNLNTINDESIKNQRKITIVEILPYLENMKKIYINIINDKNLLDPKEKDEMKKNLLENFLLMTRQKKFLSGKAVTFIFNDIYKISPFDEDIIKQYAYEGLDEIKKMTEIDENEIDQRFFFYIFLCLKNKDNINKLPSVYEEVSQPIKDFMNKYNKFINDILKGIDQYTAEILVEKCGEKSEDIVINVIKNVYGNPNYKCEKTIEDEKLYRNIKAYYMKYCPNLTRGVIELANKIPINDFYTNYNFILNKIKQYENEQEKINEIFEQINSSENNKNSFGNNLRDVYSYYDNINEKIIFYILYYYQNVKKNEFKSYKDLMVKFHIQKLIKLKNKEEENFKNELNNIANEIIKDTKLNLLEILNIYNEYKNIINNIKDIQNEEIDNINKEFDKNIINIINEKLPIKGNNKCLEEYFNNLSQDNKDKFKSQILKNISSKAKETLDLIIFPDL